MSRGPYRSQRSRHILEDWQRSRLGALRERAVRTDRGLSIVVEAGPPDADPVVMIPGAGFPPVIAADRLGALADHRRLAVVEAPGRPGLGSTKACDPNSDELAVWAEGVLDALGVDRADLVGHSAGGCDVLRIAWERPERVRRVILVSPAGIIRARTPWALLWASAAWRIAPGERTSRRVLSLVMGNAAPDPDLVEWTTLMARHVRSGPPPRALAPPVLRAVAARTLMIAGDRDPVFPAQRLVAEARRHLPDAAVEVVPGGGHVLPVECPDRVAALVEDFLAA